MAKTKGVQVSGTVTQELYDAIEDHRWDIRKTRAQVITLAVEEYAANHHLTVAGQGTENSEAEFSDQT